MARASAATTAIRPQGVLAPWWETGAAVVDVVVDGWVVVVGWRVVVLVVDGWVVVVGGSVVVVVVEVVVVVVVTGTVDVVGASPGDGTAK